ncbi:MAG TPA: ABC transporter permease [Geomonas sp.]|nr:ABC transporter permease [Geomonas sp.]
MAAANILHLGAKELRSLLRDPVMVALIVYAVTAGVYAAAKAIPDTLHNAPIAIIDQDRSQLSARIADAFYPPLFLPPDLISEGEMDRRMDAGLDSFALVIPPAFQRDVLAGRSPRLQLNVDATRMSQAFAGSGYVQAIVNGELTAFTQRHRSDAELPVELGLRVRYNPQSYKFWFSAVMELINNVTMLSIVLTGAALIREREHGTVEHLLVMPVTPFEIMAGKMWAMALVVLATSCFSLLAVVEGVLAIPVQGSLLFFVAGSALHLFATTALGIYLATVARSMPQFGLLVMLVLLPLEILSGSVTPRESMPPFVQLVMLAAPNTHLVMLAQAILFRGAGLSVIWPQYLSLLLIGATFFSLSLARFRKTIGTMA